VGPAAGDSWGMAADIAVIESTYGPALRERLTSTRGWTAVVPRAGEWVRVG